MPAVAHFVTCLGLGGTERQVFALLSGLDRRRWPVRLFCLRKEGYFVPRLRALGIEPEELRLGFTLAHPRTAVVVREIARRLLEEQVGLLHCHDLYTVLVGVPAARLAGVPVIASRRDLGHQITRLQRPALRLALRAATMVLANAATVASQVERDDGVATDHIAIVPNGLDLPTFDEDSRRPLGPLPASAGEGRRVVTIARMTYGAKGHDDLLEAAALAARLAPDLRFFIAGDGPREREVKARAAALHLDERLFFVGQRTDVAALLAWADFVVHPSRAEGMPNAVVEAMAAGKPIVATSVGGVPELIQHDRHGLLVPPADPACLAEALASLAFDPDRAARLGRAARARVEEHYTVDRLLARVERLYERVLR
jgi:glycosyltransferase involved in cell wall biosynthesis